MKKILEKIYHVLFSIYNINFEKVQVSNKLDHKITVNIEEDVNLNVNSAFRCF